MKLIFSLFLLIYTGQLFAKSVEYLPVPSNDLVKHTYYTLSYNEKYEEADWVYYTLTDSMVLNGGEERSNKFKVDKMVVTGSAKSSDYTKSGYDRGHLCPAADMGFNPVAMDESFLMSNITPQTPDFNRGIWKELETSVRNWAKKEHQIIVVTGPIFKDLKGTIGQDKIIVPGYFYKIVYEVSDRPKMIAFILPNAKSNRPLTDFVVSTDEVEKQTGLDFFSQLPDELESKLESNIELAGWFAGYTSKEPATEERSVDKTERTENDIRLYLAMVSVIFLIALIVFIKNRKKK